MSSQPPVTGNKVIDVINKCVYLLRQEDPSFKDVLTSHFKVAKIDTDFYNLLLITFINECTTKTMVEMVLDTFVMEFLSKMSNFILQLETKLYMFPQIENSTHKLINSVTNMTFEDHIINLIKYDSNEECITAAYKVLEIYSVYDLAIAEKLISLIDSIEENEDYSNDKMRDFLIGYKEKCINYVAPVFERVKDYGIRLSNYPVTEKNKIKEEKISGFISEAKDDIDPNDRERLPYEWELYAIEWKINYNGFITRKKLLEILSTNMTEEESRIYVNRIFSVVKNLKKKGIDIFQKGEEINPKSLSEILASNELTKNERLTLEYLNRQYISQTVGLIENKDLHRIYGPCNPHNNVVFTDDDICSKFGGCRMMTCYQFELEDMDESEVDITQENPAFFEIWWTNAEGRCQKCSKPILKKCHAVRQPLLGGGWKGCYCSVMCMIECLPFFGMETPSVIHDGLAQSLVHSLATIGIQDRICSNTPDYLPSFISAGAQSNTVANSGQLDIINFTTEASLSVETVEDNNKSDIPVNSENVKIENLRIDSEDVNSNKNEELPKLEEDVDLNEDVERLRRMREKMRRRRA